MTRPGWITNSPEAAAALCCADGRYHAARAKAADYPLANKILAFRAAKERLEQDYRLVEAGEYALVHGIRQDLILKRG